MAPTGRWSGFPGDSGHPSSIEFGLLTDNFMSIWTLGPTHTHTHTHTHVDTHRNTHTHTQTPHTHTHTHTHTTPTHTTHRHTDTHRNTQHRHTLTHTHTSKLQPSQHLIPRSHHSHTTLTRPTNDSVHSNCKAQPPLTPLRYHHDQASSGANPTSYRAWNHHVLTK